MATFQIIGQNEKIAGLLAATGQVKSDDELRETFKRYSLSYDPSEVFGLPDPWSPDYTRMVMELYARVAGREYEPFKTEQTAVNIDNLYNTFPFVTKSPATAGAYFHFLGETLGMFAGLKPGSSVLEFGPGWGETTLALARLGYDVTCIDINPDFIEIIRRKATAMALNNIDLIVDDFSVIGRLDKTFDAILFFECFHHCVDHAKLLGQCCDHLRPEGRIIFSGEPVVADFPVPWGLRLDGQSLWSTAIHGWLELGFQQRYFEELLRRNRLLFRRRELPNFAFFNTYVAYRTQRLDPTTSPFASIVGHRDGDTIKAAGKEGFLLYGPYMPLSADRYDLRCHYEFKRHADVREERAVLHLWHDGGKTLVASAPLPPGAFFELKFKLPTDAAALEFVVEVGSRTDFTFRFFELSYG